MVYIVKHKVIHVKVFFPPLQLIHVNRHFRSSLGGHGNDRSSISEGLRGEEMMRSFKAIQDKSFHLFTARIGKQYFVVEDLWVPAFLAMIKDINVPASLNLS